eukprot:COSAG06_NODE_4650_length_4067_cov_2.554688_5_plen_62_part_00
MYLPTIVPPSMSVPAVAAPHAQNWLHSPSPAVTVISAYEITPFVLNLLLSVRSLSWQTIVF